MSNLSNGEYEELKAFLLFYSDRYMPVDSLPPHLRPVACLEVLERKSRTMASKGLAQAINDIIQSSRHLEPEQLRKVDRELQSRGLVTLSQLRRRYSREYAKVLKKGRIANETEYYLVRGILDDNAGSFGDGEREALAQMLVEFEQRADLQSGDA